MKELIDLLISLVIENDDPEEDELDSILPGGADIPRLNN